MTGTTITFVGGPIFDGETLLNGQAARFVDGVLDSILPEAQLSSGEEVEDLSGDILSPRLCRPAGQWRRRCHVQ